jgi:hypothetical protein
MHARYRRTTEATTAPIAVHLAGTVLACLIIAVTLATLVRTRHVENTGLAAYTPPPRAVVPEYTRRGPDPVPDLPPVVTVQAEPEPPPETAIAGVVVEAPRPSPRHTAKTRTATANHKPEKPRREAQRNDGSRARARPAEFAHAEITTRVSASPFPGYAAVR